MVFWSTTLRSSQGLPVPGRRSRFPADEAVSRQTKPFPGRRSRFPADEAVSRQTKPFPGRRSRFPLSAVRRRIKGNGGFQIAFSSQLVVNEVGQLLKVNLTPGNVDDRRPLPDLLQGLRGKIFGECALRTLRERGYVSQKLANQLLEALGIHFFALTSS